MDDSISTMTDATRLISSLKPPWPTDAANDEPGRPARPLLAAGERDGERDLDVQAGGRDGGDDLAKLELVQDGCLAGGVKAAAASRPPRRQGRRAHVPSSVGELREQPPQRRAHCHTALPRRPSRSIVSPLRPSRSKTASTPKGRALLPLASRGSRRVVSDVEL